MKDFLILMGWPGEVQCPDDDAMAKAMADAGFNVAMWDEGKLDLCAKHGMKVLVDPASPEIAARAARHPAAWGYYLKDEPQAGEFEAWVQQVGAVRKADPGHPTWINLLSSAGDYLTSFIDTVHPEILSYDYYQWWWGTQRHFPCLEEHRAAALRAGIPLICWIEVNAGSAEWNNDAPAPPDNLEKLRESVYTSLAYGVKGVEWFTASKMFDAKTSKLKPCGKDVTTINAELKQLGPVLVELESADVFHTPPVPAQTRELPPGYRMQTRTHDLVLGVLKHRAEPASDYLMVANREIHRGRWVVLRLARAVREVAKLEKPAGRWQPLPLTKAGRDAVVEFIIGPGDGELLRVR